MERDELFCRMNGGRLYYCTDERLMAEQQRCLERLYEYNQTRPSEPEKRAALLREMFAAMGEGCYIEPPFHANWGGEERDLRTECVCQFQSDAGG